MPDIKIKSLSIKGYRSFGSVPQRFERLSKINLVIGQNNSGKSNVLRFIDSVYSNVAHKTYKAEPLDKHQLHRANLSVGISIDLSTDSTGALADFNDQIVSKFPEAKRNTQSPGYILNALKAKARIDGTTGAWFEYDENGSLSTENWKEAFETVDPGSIQQVWTILTGSGQGSFNQHWYPGTLNLISPKIAPIATEFIPAIRQIGEAGSESSDFSGLGIIERLAKLQNPDVHNRADRLRFDNINKFLINITGNETAEIEIPHDKKTVLVHMDGKTLPLEYLGTGIHEVLILAAASTISENTVICMEEPELHLNPILQKKLVRYLLSSTNNQYFISTHSNSFMDTPEAEIFHIRLVDSQSIVSRVTSDKHKSHICEDLGYHPSDLLQSNCIIWVEGPSDRIYLKRWILEVAPHLVEGIHFSVMFYGGRLASHLSGEDIEELLEDFISLRRLNRNAVIIMDSDKSSSHARINSTKERLKKEFNDGDGFAWITQGREIENYIEPDRLKAAISATSPSATINSKFGKYDSCLDMLSKKGEKTQPKKVQISNHVIESDSIELDILDLKKRINELVLFIETCNPKI